MHSCSIISSSKTPGICECNSFCIHTSLSSVWLLSLESCVATPICHPLSKVADRWTDL